LLANAGVDVANISLAGGSLLADDFTYAGNLVWTSGSVDGSGLNPGLTTSGMVGLVGGILNTDWTITPTGTVDWTGSDQQALVINDATITNQGIFTIYSFIETAQLRLAGKDFSASTNAGFINQGTMIIDANDDIVDFSNLVFDNQGGTIGIASGTFTLGAQDLVLDAGESLQGFGTFAGNVVNQGGLVSPGRTDPVNGVYQTGRLTIDGDFTQGSNGTLLFELDSTLSGLLNDQLNVTGQLNADGEVAFGIINNKSVLEIAALLDQSFRPINASSFSGGFSSVSIPSGLNFELGPNGIITITSGNPLLNKIANELEVLFNQDNLNYFDIVRAMKFIDQRFNLLASRDEEDEDRRAPRLVCK
jgi:hypothetical protein